MPRALSELAAKVSGEVRGDGALLITDVAPLDQARAGELSFLANPKYRERALSTSASALLVCEPLDGYSGSQVVCESPYLALATIAADLHPPRAFPSRIHARACVDPSATIDKTASVEAGAVVEGGARVGAGAVVGANCVVGADAVVGEQAVMHPGSKLLDRCELGARSILQAGAIVGGDGFGYAPDASGKRVKIPQVGVVIVESDVEIGVNSTIDRATFGRTVIGSGTKIDNLVQVAHNVQTGNNCVVVAQSGIAGSTVLGDRVVMGAQTGTVGHIRLDDDVTLAARAAATHDLFAGVYGGVPAVAHREWLKFSVALPKLPELRRRLRQVEKQLEAFLGTAAE